MDWITSLRYIKAIAEARSISAAAENLKISQPALSAYLKKLENNLNTVLFDRAKQPLEITEAGMVYLEYAQKFSALSREFKQQISDMDMLKTGSLTIGGAASFNTSYLPKTIAQFMSAYPGVDIDVVDGNIPDITLKALNGQIDLFISPQINSDSRLRSEELLEEDIFLCVPSQWKINRKLEKFAIDHEIIKSGMYSGKMKEGIPVTDFNEFKDCPFILLKKSQHIGRTMSRLFDKYGLEPKKTITVEQTMTSYSLTLAGVGISLMTESTIKGTNFKEYPCIYMVDKQICRRKIYAVYSAQRYFSKAARVFISMLKKNLV